MCSGISSWFRSRQEGVTAHTEERKTEPNPRERKRGTHHASVHTAGERDQDEDEDMNFCVNMVKCASCMTVWEDTLPLDEVGGPSNL